MGISIEAEGFIQGACTVQNFVPIVRLSASIKDEEQTLADQEATALKELRITKGVQGEEVFLPYGFLSDSPHGQANPRT
jgi:hypothetical protein